MIENNGRSLAGVLVGGFLYKSRYSALCHYNLVTGTNKQFYSILNY